MNQAINFEILLIILKYLPIKEIGKCQLVCKQWHHLLNDDWCKKILIDNEIKRRFKRYKLLDRFVFFDYNIFGPIKLIALDSNLKERGSFVIDSKIGSIMDLKYKIGIRCSYPPHKLNIRIYDGENRLHISSVNRYFYILPNEKEIKIIISQSDYPIGYIL